jgi:hypothetical protein
MAGYLPPVVIDFLGNAKPFITVVGEVKSLLGDLEKGTHDVPIGANSKPFQADLATVKAELLKLVTTARNVPLGADAKPFWSKVALLHGEVLAMGAATVPVDANVKAALAKVAALRALIDETKLSMGIGLGVTGAAGLAGAGAAGAAGAGGIFAQLGMGGGIGGLASFGTIAGIAGFGFEHVLTTMVGIIGSAIGASLGGLMLAGTSMAVGGVGFLTDLAGTGQAMGDIHTVSSDMSALSRAIAVYGKNSSEAADATNQLKYDLSGFNQVARAAVVQAAEAAQGFKTMFDKFTGPAEKTGAQIITSVIQMAEGYLPSIGKFAAENMVTIKKALGPLFDWLDSRHGGLGIFNEIETKFSKDLPAATKAFDQAVELVMKTIGLLTPRTGGLMADIEKGLAHLSTPKGWDRWATEVEKLVNLFHTWDEFAKMVVVDLAAIFGKSAGLGSGIIKVLTTDLQQLHKAIESTAGGTSLSSLFTTHKAEVINLIQAVVALGTAFTRTYLLIAPFCVSVVAQLAKALGGLVNLINRVPGGAYVLGLTMIAERMKVLGPLFTGATTNAGLLQKAFGALGKVTGLQAAFTAVRGALGALTSSMLVTKETTTGLMVSTEELTVAQKLLTTTGLFIAAAGVYELTKHFGVLRGLMISGAVAVGGLTIAMWALDAVPIVAVIAGIGLGVAGLVAGIIELVKHWREAWTTVKNVATATWHFLDGIWHAMEHGVADAWGWIRGHLGIVVPAAMLLITGPIGGMVAFLAMHWRTVLADVRTGWNAVVSFFSGLPGKILRALGNLGNLLVNAGKALLEGLVHGLTGALGGVERTVKGIGSKVLGFFKSIWHVFSPSRDMIVMGQQLIEGFKQGLEDKGRANAVLNYLHTLWGQMSSYMKTLPPLMQSLGVQLMQGLARGIQAGTAQAVAAAVASANAVTAATKATTKTQSPSLVYAAIGSDLMAGLAQGIRSAAPLAKSAMVSSLNSLTPSAASLAGHGGIGGGITMTNHYTVTVQAPAGTGPGSLTPALKQAFAAHDADLVRRLKAGSMS